MIGIALAALGVIVLVVAILALRQPRGHHSSASADTPSAGPSSSVRTSSPSPSSAGPSRHSKSAARSASPSPPSTASSTATAPAAGDAKSFHLVVLNDTTTPGLAQQAAQRFESGGWTVDRYTNLPSSISDIISSCAYYDPNTKGAQQAANALRTQYPTIQRVQPQFSDLDQFNSPVVVVLTPGYSSN